MNPVALDGCGLLTQLGKVRQALGLGRGQDGAESRDAVEQMTDKLAHGKSAGRWLPILPRLRNQSNQVSGTLDLFANLFEQSVAQWGIRHASPPRLGARR